MRKREKSLYIRPMEIQIFITHYVNRDIVRLNDILLDEIEYIERVTIYPHTITIVYNGDKDSSRKDENNSDKELYERIPSGVRLIKNDRPGRSDIQNSLRNKIIDLADDTLFILLHNDIRVSIGWLDCLVSEMTIAENKWGVGNVIISPRFIPYHYLNPRIETKYPEFWLELRDNIKCLSIERMREWCRNWKFKMDEYGNVYSLPPGNITDDGSNLIMFIGRKSFFTDRISGAGYYDERYTGINYDDNDMGITVLMRGKKNLKSQTCLIGHIEGLSYFQPKIINNRPSNDKIFIEKWGSNIWNEMESGQLWIRLHNGQNNKIKQTHLMEE